jgi:probable F420-dependent oxidoreductase
VEFAITFKGDIAPEREVALCRQAEEGGFDYAWFFDSHVLWPECYTTMAVCMRETRRLRFGPCVTNPGIRDWTVAASTFANLARLSGGRFDLGVGRGDSSLRVLGRKPDTIQHMVDFSHTCKKLVAGEKVEHQGRTVQLTWSEHRMPVWYAAYGPRALAATGQNADGLIIQLADPWLVEWFVGQAREARRAAGLGDDLRVMVAAPVWVGDLARGREQTRWFPALVGNHVADLVERYGGAGGAVPQRLTDYIQGRKGYDYTRHAQKDNPYLDFISDDIIDSFCVLGPPEAHVEKLRQLRRAGVTQFNIYLMVGEEERNLEEYIRHVLPAFR